MHGMLSRHLGQAVGVGAVTLIGLLIASAIVTGGFDWGPLLLVSGSAAAVSAAGAITRGQ